MFDTIIACLTRRCSGQENPAMSEAGASASLARIDRRSARRRFERAARGYAGAAKLEAEIGMRMLERLDYVRVAPRRILDAGAGPAREAAALVRRYPRSALYAADFSLAMLRRARSGAGLLARLRGAPRPFAVCADLERLPLAGASIDLVWSNMALHWLEEPLDALRELNRVLTEDGLLMLSTLGPDTLRELREAAGGGRVHAFLDMHDLGDRLVAAGFSAPVIDMERLTVTYPSGDALLDELRATGQTSSLASRPRGLAGRGFRARLRAALESTAREGRIAATFEVVYAHAWRGRPARSDGKAVVNFDPRRRAPR
jgi:malonyl-CoA O-methyltransferase